MYVRFFDTFSYVFSYTFIMSSYSFKYILNAVFTCTENAINVRTFFRQFSDIFLYVIKNEMTKPFNSTYDGMRNESEFTKFTEIFDKVLKRRGIERKKYRRDLEDYFCHVRISDQMRAKEQLKELFGRIRDLRKNNHELYEQCEEQQHIIDSLRRELHESLKIIEVEATEVLVQKDRCNQDIKP